MRFKAPAWRPVVYMSHCCRLYHPGQESCMQLVVSVSLILEGPGNHEGAGLLGESDLGHKHRSARCSNQDTQATSLWLFAFSAESK